MQAITKLQRLWTGANGEGAPQADWPWRFAFVIGAVLLAVSAFLPLWRMTLHAPQYPGGLELTAYGTEMEGDLEEINSLNHYIGVQPIEPDSVIELTLFPFAVGIAVVVLLAVAAFVPRRSITIGAIALAWTFPIGLLVDLQWWLYRFGHELDPTAPVRVDPFTPKVIGSTEVVNFESETMVASGFWAMLLAALIVTLGPITLRFLRDSWNNTETRRVAATGAVAVAATTYALAPGQSASADEGNTASIAQQIEQARPGDTLLIPAGTYEEQLVIDRTVSLIADGTVIIDGGGQGDVVVITAPDVTLDGFTVQNSGRDVSNEPTGIRIVADGATIQNNTVRDALYGISLLHSNGHIVRNNHVSSVLEYPTERRGHAIYLYYTADNVVEDNTVITAKDGIFVGFGDRNQIDRNQVSDVRYGIHYMYANDNSFTGNSFQQSIAGAALMYSEGLTLADNEFAHNTSRASGYGLLIKDVDDVVITGNQIHNNRLGMTLEGVPSSPGGTALVADNLIGFNQTAMEFFSTTRITFTGNSFVGNLRQVEGRGGPVSASNLWSLDGRGNYWDTYEGYDATGDGFGDRPYEHRGAYESLMERHPALQGYAFTVAHQSFELAARWFAPHRAEPILTDPAPLMRPSVSLAGNDSASTRWLLGALSAVAVGAVGLAMYSSRRTLERRWPSC